MRSRAIGSKKQETDLDGRFPFLRAMSEAAWRRALMRSLDERPPTRLAWELGPLAYWMLVAMRFEVRNELNGRPVPSTA